MHQKVIRWLYYPLLWCACVSLWTTACGESSVEVEPPPEIVVPPEDNPTQPPPDTTDPDNNPEDIRPTPCTGSLCFNENDPEIQTRIQEYRDWAHPRMLNYIYQWEEYEDEDEAKQLAKDFIDADIEDMAWVAGLCNYYEDELGRVRVQCPEALYPYYTCPHMWFKEPFLALGGLRFKTGDDPICYPDLRPKEHVFCIPHGCREGTVCSGFFGHDPDLSYDDGIEGPLPVCLPIDTCLELREAHQLPVERSCIYRDRTTVQSGQTLIVDDCDSLEEGLCASNCPCASPNATCEFLSETEAVGICATTTCLEYGANPVPCKEHEVCAGIGSYVDFSMDGWVDLRAIIASFLLDELSPPNAITSNLCVAQGSCESFRDRADHRFYISCN